MSFTIDSTTWRSPNYNDRPPGTDIWALIIHSCEGSPAGNEQQSSLPWLCNPSSEVSSHYYITREANIYQLVPDAKRAWHAGESVLNGVWYCNNYSIGIELEHRDNAAPYPTVQMQALTWLAQRLITAYVIPRSGIATHRHVAQAAGRTDKYDPADISDADFNLWANALYAGDPLRARSIAGSPGQPARYCSVPIADFYTQRGGLAYNGYPLADEYTSTFGPKDTPCSIFPCERVVFKRSANYGVEQALIPEARAEGWIK